MSIPRGLEKDANKGVEALDQEVALYAIGPLIEEVKEEYRDLANVVRHLDEIRDDILGHLSALRSSQQEESPEPPRMPGTPQGEEERTGT